MQQLNIFDGYWHVVFTALNACTAVLNVAILSCDLHSSLLLLNHDWFYSVDFYFIVHIITRPHRMYAVHRMQPVAADVACSVVRVCVSARLSHWRIMQ